VSQEGPHSTLNEEEFYDAVETGLDKMEEEVEFRHRLKQQQGAFTMMAPDSRRSEKEHPLWESVSTRVHLANLARQHCILNLN